MNEAKIRLSEKEMELVTNADWILTKNGIMQKAKYLLEGLQERQTPVLQTSAGLPKEVLKIAPKISRGENYKGLPWLVLDQPRQFGKADIFAIRTMFWWGNFFSITLHLSGSYKKQFAEHISTAYALLKKKGFFLCSQENEWEHHFDTDNYVPVKSYSQAAFSGRMQQGSFIKLAKKIPLDQWHHAADTLFDHFTWLIRMLTVQLPSR